VALLAGLQRAFQYTALLLELLIPGLVTMPELLISCFGIALQPLLSQTKRNELPHRYRIIQVSSFAHIHQTPLNFTIAHGNRARHICNRVRAQGHRFFGLFTACSTLAKCNRGLSRTDGLLPDAD